MKVKESHIALFGNVAIKRIFCEQCRVLALAVKGKTACCDKNTDEMPRIWKRESDAVDQRKRPSKEKQDEQLQAQDHRCLYCNCLFGQHVRYRGRLTRLRITWDHFAPFSYSRNNQDVNFVAACQICNGLKSNFCFQTLEEAQIYVQSRRDKKRSVPRMRPDIHPQAEMAEILPVVVPVGDLEQGKPPRKECPPASGGDESWVTRVVAYSKRRTTRAQQGRRKLSK